MTTQLSGSQKMQRITEYCTLAKRSGFVKNQKKNEMRAMKLPPQPLIANKADMPLDSIDSNDLIISNSFEQMVDDALQAPPEPDRKKEAPLDQGVLDV